MGNINWGKYIIIFCVFGTVIIVPFVYLPIISVYDFFYFPKYIFLCIISCLLLIVLIRNLKSIDGLIQFDWINKLLFLYFVLITISLLFSIDPMLSIRGGYLRYDGYSTQLMYMILFLFARSIKSIDKRFIYAVSITSAILSVYGILQYYGFELFIRDFVRINWKSAFSTFGNQNFFGSFLVLQIPFSLYIISVYKQKWAYITYGLALLALLMTMTRSAWLGSFVSIFFVSIFLFKFNKDFWIVFVYSLLIIIGFNLSTNNLITARFLTLVNDTKVLASTSYDSNPEVIERLGSVRMFIWIRVVELIKMRPLFGWGIENLSLAFDRFYYNDIIKLLGYYASSDKAHNDFLHIAVSSGVPSLIAYLSFLLMIAYQAIRKFYSNINILLFASILGYMVCLFFNISVISVAYILWIYLGILCRYNT